MHIFVVLIECHMKVTIPCPALGMISSVEKTSVILFSIDKDLDKALADIEGLKDKVRENGKSY